MHVLLQTVSPTLQQATPDPPLHQRLPDTSDFLKSESESCSAMSDSLWLHGYTVPEILQARILEWVAISISRGSSQPRDGTLVAHIVGRYFTIWVREANHLVWPRVNSREGTQLHPWTENWFKDLLSMTLPIRTRPSFPLSQSLQIGSFNKPLILLHQRADRMKITLREN